jgi:hypothetical protein
MTVTTTMIGGGLGTLEAADAFTERPANSAGTNDPKRCRRAHGLFQHGKWSANSTEVRPGEYPRRSPLECVRPTPNKPASAVPQAALSTVTTISARQLSASWKSGHKEAGPKACGGRVVACGSGCEVCRIHRCLRQCGELGNHALLPAGPASISGERDGTKKCALVHHGAL